MPNPRHPGGAAGAGGRRVVAAGAPRVAAAARPGGSGPKSHRSHLMEDDVNDDEQHSVLDSIVGLMENDVLEPPTARQDCGSGNRKPSHASKDLLNDLLQMEQSYTFLASFASSSRQATEMESTTDTNDGLPSRGDTESTSFGDDHQQELGREANSHMSMTQLRALSHEDLLHYAMRLTTICSAFMAQERHRHQTERSDSDSDDGKQPSLGDAATPDLLTASIRSFARPPVRTTNQVQKSTDFEGNKTINEYSIIAELGRGAYGKVKLAVNNKTNETCAIKIMKKAVLKKGTTEQVVKREIAVMKKLRHRNIVHLIEVLDDPDADKIYMVMKYIDNGPMVHIKADLTCNTLPLDVATRYLRQLLSGLQYLHKHNVIHRDLKPDNVMLDSTGTVYLTDFGVSDIVATDSAAISGMEGTPVFLAPELLQASNNGVKGPPVDLWALGVTFYFAVFGVAPFTGKSWTAIAEQVVKEPITFPKTADKDWVDVLSKLLEKDPKKRITIKDLKKHKMFDYIALDHLYEESTMENSGSLPSGDDSPRGIHVTEDEIRGSMRRVPHPIDEDESAFDNIGGNVRSTVRSFVQGLRHRIAGKQLLASIAGEHVVEEEVDVTRSMSPEAHPDLKLKRVSKQPTPPTSRNSHRQRPTVGGNNNGSGASSSGVARSASHHVAASASRPPAGVSQNPRVVAASGAKSNVIAADDDITGLGLSQTAGGATTPRMPNPMPISARPTLKGNTNNGSSTTPRLPAIAGAKGPSAGRALR